MTDEIRRQLSNAIYELSLAHKAGHSIWQAAVDGEHGIGIQPKNYFTHRQECPCHNYRKLQTRCPRYNYRELQARMTVPPFWPIAMLKIVVVAAAWDRGYPGRSVFSWLLILFPMRAGTPALPGRGNPRLFCPQARMPMLPFWAVCLGDLPGLCGKK